MKKLTIKTEFNVPSNLKDLRLKYLAFYHCGRENILLEFLRHQADLKVLKLKLSKAKFSGEDLSMICELKQLETFELEGRARDGSGLNKLYQLEKLKRLTVNSYVCPNILDHLKFGVFSDLEELDARFEDASMESVQEMKRITPNLKKLEIQYASSDTNNALLETLNNLEDVKIGSEYWEISSGKVYPNIKHLEVYPTSGFDFGISAAELTQQFPNLEFLEIDCVCLEVKESSFVELLSGLKRLKTLEMRKFISKTKIESEFVLPCFEKYGSHLETVRVRAVESGDLLKEPHGVIGFTIEKQPNEGFRFGEVFSGADSD